MYPIIAFIVTVLLCLLTALVIALRYCCCCCGPSRCTCLRCGTPWPTRRTKCCGFSETHDGKMAYSQFGRVAAVVLMVAFLVAATTLIIISIVLGNYGLSTALPNLDSGFDSAALVVQSSVPPLVTLAIALSADVLLPSLLKLNTTVSNVVDLVKLETALASLNVSMYNLPNVTVTISLVKAAITDVELVQSAGAALLADVTALGGTQVSATSLVGGLQTSVGEIASAQSAYLSLNAIASAAISEAASFKSVLTGGTPTGGALGTLAADLSTLSSSPNATLIASSVTDLLLLSNGSLTNGDTVGIAKLVSDLTSLESTVAGLLPVVASAQTQLNVAWSALTAANSTNSTGLVAQLNTLYLDLTNFVNGLPPAGTLVANAHGLKSAADSVNASLPDVRANILQVNSTLHALSDSLLVQIKSSVAAFTSIKFDALMSVVEVVTAAVNSVDKSLMSGLPVAKYESLTNSVNETITSANVSIAEIESNFNKSQATINAVHVTPYLTNVSSLQSSVNDGLALVGGGSALYSALSAYNTSLSEINLSTLQSAIASLTSSLNSISVEEYNTASSNLASMGVALAALNSSLTPLVAPWPVGQYPLFAGGYCSLSATTPCLTNADCSSDVCVGVGVRRCFGADSATACTVNADCPTTARCLTDEPTAAGLAVAVGALSSLQTFGSLPTLLNSIDAAVLALNPTQYSSDLSTLGAGLNAVNAGSYLSTLSSLQAGLSGFDTSSLLNTLQTNLAKLSTATATMQSAISTLEGVEPTLVDLRTNYRSVLLQAHDGVAFVRGFFNTELPAYASLMSRSALTALVAQKGPTAMFSTLLVNVAQRALKYIASYDSISGVPSIPASDWLNTYGPYLDKISGTGSTPDSTTSGSYYFFGQLLWPSYVLPANDTTAQYVMSNSAGVRYPNGKYCVTTACITNTINKLNSAPMSSLQSTFPGYVPTQVEQVDASREQLLLGLWVFPVIAILLGVWALFSKCCCRKPTWQKLPSSFAAACMICQLPCIFILSGIVFPVLLFTGDTCASGLNVGSNYILSYPSICSAFGGTGDVSSCTVTATFPLHHGDQNFTFWFNPLGDYENLVTNKCEDRDPLVDAFKTTLSQLRDEPFQEFDYYLDGWLVRNNYTLNGDLMDVAYSAVNSTTAHVFDFFTTEVGLLGSCAAVSNMINSVKEMPCCTLLTPLYFYVTCWYIMGWLMCCCGIPAACLGRKRFPSTPWGPAYEMAVGTPISGVKPDTVVSTAEPGDPSPMGVPVGAAPVALPGTNYDATHEVDQGSFHPDSARAPPSAREAAPASSRGAPPPMARTGSHEESTRSSFPVPDN